MSEAATDDLATRLKRMLSTGAFQQLMGIELVSCDADDGMVALRLPWQAQFERGPATRQWHGGPIAALIDIAGDFALIAKLGRGIPTIDLRIDYLRPAIDTSLTAIAHTRRAGRSVGVVDITVSDDRAFVVALGRGTYSTLPPAG